MKRVIIVFEFALALLFHSVADSQNVVVAVIDGARYSETFGAKETYIPKIWEQLQPKGMIWTNFRNEELTKTDPGHSSIVTGTWQIIDNKGIERPTEPTVFEYFRKATAAPESTCVLIVGKHKLNIIAQSSHKDYGEKYKAVSYIEKDDIAVIGKLKEIFIQNHPRIIVVNLPSTDRGGHSGNWDEYISAIKIADSLVYDIWQTLEADPFYRNNTTLIVTNDHGRHDDLHGGFEDHGDGCEGCRHIMLLVVGRGFPSNHVVSNLRTQCDIVPTIGELLSFPTPNADGTSLLRDTTSVTR